jgi:DNA-binding FrmR family transcriptional regulator
MATATTRPYTATKDQLLARLGRMEGRVRGVACHARHCVIDGQADGSPEELTDEMMAAVGRHMRRG